MCWATINSRHPAGATLVAPALLGECQGSTCYHAGPVDLPVSSYSSHCTYHTIGPSFMNSAYHLVAPTLQHFANDLLHRHAPTASLPSKQQALQLANQTNPSDAANQQSQYGNYCCFKLLRCWQQVCLFGWPHDCKLPALNKQLANTMKTLL